VSVLARVRWAVTIPGLIAVAIAGSHIRSAAAVLPPVTIASSVNTAGAHSRVSDADIDIRSRDSAGGAVDLYGNPVSDAVAEYSLDSTGSLYELHSPRTELPRLSPPKS